MPYNDHFASRVRQALAGTPKVEEKKMMGGLTFMVNSKMCVSIMKDDLMARIDPELYETALKMKGARQMDFTNESR